MDIELLHPAWLLLLLGLPFLFLFPRRPAPSGGQGGNATQGPALRAAILRALVMALLVFAAARPVAVSESADLDRVLIVDRGPAATDAEATRLLEEAGQILASAQDGERWHVLHVTTPERRLAEPLAEAEEWRALEATADAPLGAALRRAADMVPAGGGGGLVYLGLGASSDSDWGPALADLGARGLPLDIAPFEADVRGLRAVSLKPLDEIRVGQETTLRLQTEGPASRFRVRLSEGETVVVEGELVDGGENAAIDLRFAPSQAGFITYRAEIIDAKDTVVAGGSLERELAVQDPLRVLYLGHARAGGGEQLDRTLGSGFAVETPSPGELPDAETMRGYHAVVLDDRPASTMGETFMQSLTEAVRRDGVGLFACGGPQAFGPGGWHDTPVGGVLPVEMVQKEEKKDPSTSLAIIIDTSGSMGGNRIRLAKEVTRLAIRRLLPHDKIGIVEFYGNKRWAAPLQSAANAIEIQRALNRLDAGGGTILFPALEEAYYGLRNVQTRYKHVLILTDAGVETGPYEALLRRMARDGICVSTVLTGPGRHSDFLVQLADWGGGRYYNASNRFNLPEIMLKQPSTARLPAYRPGEITVRASGGPRWWGDIDRSEIPALAGYVETRGRPGAERILDTERDGHPVLASWRYGLGRVTAFTSEPTGPGTEPWRDWEAGSEFLGRALRATSSLAREPFRYRLRRQGRDFSLIAERLVEAPLLPRAERLLGPDDGLPLVFERRAPGTFEARGRLDAEESLRLLAGQPGRHRRLVATAASTYPGAFGRADVGAPRLDALAASTGGRRLATLTETPSVGASRAPVSLFEWRPWVLLLALLIYLADVVSRRWPRLRSELS